MNRALEQALVIARRDFLATVRAKSFLFFLLGPLLMIGFGMMGAAGAGAAEKGMHKDARLIVLTAPADMADLARADKALRTLMPPKAVAETRFIAADADPAAQARRLIADKDFETRAILYGPLAAPTILRTPDAKISTAFLAQTASDVLKVRASPQPVAAAPILIDHEVPSGARDKRSVLAMVGVITIFMLTLIMASQAIGMLAEEKSNKVIEVLAAAAPLESVFFGKLLGMLGIALVFIAFWGTLIGLALSQGAALIRDPEVMAVLHDLAPAVGWPMFAALLFVYFVMSFLLLGALFIGVGAQAATQRDIQMLSLPLTVLQVGMLTLAQGAAGNPDGWMARAAQIIPFSSPMGMIARAAHDPALWPHPLALAWQALWVLVAIWFGVRLFRTGVLKSGGKPWWKRRRAARS